jgi:hypothetical protein
VFAKLHVAHGQQRAISSRDIGDRWLFKFYGFWLLDFRFDSRMLRALPRDDAVSRSRMAHLPRHRFSRAQILKPRICDLIVIRQVLDIAPRQRFLRDRRCDTLTALDPRAERIAEKFLGAQLGLQMAARNQRHR